MNHKKTMGETSGTSISPGPLEGDQEAIYRIPNEMNIMLIKYKPITR